MEKKVNELIEESCFANDRGEFPLVRYSVLISTTNQTVSNDSWYKPVLFSFLRCSETALSFQKWFFYGFSKNYYQLFNVQVSVISFPFLF